MQPRAWYTENNVQVELGNPVEEIDAEAKRVRTRLSGWVNYDTLVLATGSSAALPPGVTLDKYGGVFVYRTLQDLEDIMAWSKRENVTQAAVVGGGLLGLEAAKAAKDLGLDVSIYERSDRLMARQLDCDASRVLVAEIEKLGLKSIIGDCPMELEGDEESNLKSFKLGSGETHTSQMAIYAIGIRPRDGLSQSTPQLKCAARGGFVVNDRLETSIPDVFAIGECASHNDMVYGLVAPGYE